MICFYCKKEIDRENEGLFFISLDRPYVNIPVHKSSCLREIEFFGTENYVKENLEDIYTFAEKTPVVKKGIKRK